MSRWEPWIGRSETSADRVDEARLARWLATLDRSAPEDGTAPQGFHWCLCTPDDPTARLGADGHRARDETAAGFLPPAPLPRRMWASSRLDFHQPLRAGEPVGRTSRIISIKEKQGSSGELLFVDIEHRLDGSAGLAIRELQTIVYCEPVVAGGQPAAADPDEQLPSEAAAGTASRTIRPSEALLFRYSALTFNSHRIHYDKPWAVDAEGYAGVVVQGPLTATLLLDLARRELGDNRLEHFSFRGVSPAIANEELVLTMTVAGAEVVFIASTSRGRPVMTARGRTQFGG